MWGFVTLICLLLVLIDYKLSTFGMFTVRSNVDNRPYSVVQSMRNHNDASDMLSKLNYMNISVIKYMKKKYQYTPYEIYVDRLAEKYNPDVLGEHIPLTKDNTSYVMNKGERIRFCLRPNTNRSSLHDINILTFVSLHEISHIMNETMGHDNDFWGIFKFLLINAVELGVYTPIDYAKHPVLYCNIQVNYNPLYDDSTPTFVP